MSRKNCRHYNPTCATIDFHLKHCTRHRDVLTGASRNARSRPMTTIATPALCPSVKRISETLPDPWLFDSEKLMREIDRCREMVLLIPAPTHETHFAINIAISAIWNLREDLRYLLSLHRDGHRAWERRAREAEGQSRHVARKQPAKAIATHKAPAWKEGVKARMKA